MAEVWIAICDDLKEERAALAHMVQAYGKRHGDLIHLALFSGGEELLEKVQRGGRFQILFLDIYMPGLSGVETARRIRAKNDGMAIIFATTSQDHGVDSFEVQASDYLVKPFRQEDVDRVLDWCLKHETQVARSLPIYSEGEQWDVPLVSIQYIEILDHHSRIHLKERDIITRRSLEEMEVAMNSQDFLRCHRSYLVNLNFVQGMEGNSFRMADGDLVPIGSANLTWARSQFIDWTYAKAWGRK